MFRNKNDCPNCHESYDALEKECPNCHEVNKDAIAFSDNTIILPGPKQLTFLLLGYFGLQGIAVILELLAIAILGTSQEALLSPSNLGIIEFATYGIAFVIFMALVYKNKTFFNKGWKNWRIYVVGIIGGFILLAANGGYGNIISSIHDFGVNKNQEMIDDVVRIYPLLSLLIFGFIGPVCEELTYRVGLFTFFARFNKKVAYIVSILIFAFIHFDATCFIEAIANKTANPIVTELINLPNYLIGGIVLSYLYDKFGLASSLSAHIINNVVSILPAMLLIYGK